MSFPQDSLSKGLPLDNVSAAPSSITHLDVSNTSALRAFVARIVGWTDPAAIDQAFDALAFAKAHHTALVLLGETDLVPIARALHQRIWGLDEQPFVVCDPRRRDGKRYQNVRAPLNYGTGLAAFKAAQGGSLCFRSHRLPADFAAVRPLIQYTDDVQVIVCVESQATRHPFLIKPAPLYIPSLRARTHELPRIVDEYAVDAITTLRALGEGLSAADRQWIVQHETSSLAQIEKATLRLLALRISRSTASAAERLGMEPVSLLRWAKRHGLSQ